MEFREELTEGEMRQCLPLQIEDMTHEELTALLRPFITAAMNSALERAAKMAELPRAGAANPYDPVQIAADIRALKLEM